MKFRDTAEDRQTGGLTNEKTDDTNPISHSVYFLTRNKKGNTITPYVFSSVWYIVYTALLLNALFLNVKHEDYSNIIIMFFESQRRRLVDQSSLPNKQEDHVVFDNSYQKPMFSEYQWSSLSYIRLVKRIIQSSYHFYSGIVQLRKKSYSS